MPEVTGNPCRGADVEGFAHKHRLYGQPLGRISADYVQF
jgi:hypothetical protein